MVHGVQGAWGSGCLDFRVHGVQGARCMGVQGAWISGRMGFRVSRWTVGCHVRKQFVCKPCANAPHRTAPPCVRGVLKVHDYGGVGAKDRQSVLKTRQCGALQHRAGWVD